MMLHEPKKRKRLKALLKEMKSLHKNHSYELVKLPSAWKQSRISSFSYWTLNRIAHGQGTRCDTVIDFKEFSSPTNLKKIIIIKKSSIRVILGLAVNTNLEIEQLDVKSNLIFGYINEEIYID